MEVHLDPLVAALAVLAALHVLYGAGLIVAPSAAVTLERRLFYPTAARLRTVGALLLGLGLLLIATARGTRATYGEIAYWIEALGWFTAAFSAWTIAAPGLWLRFAVSFWDAVDEPALRRAIGLLTLALGGFLGWIALAES
jgi:uncharacterized protein YjeT (DUF2065 family)